MGGLVETFSRPKGAIIWRSSQRKRLPGHEMAAMSEQTWRDKHGGMLLPRGAEAVEFANVALGDLGAKNLADELRRDRMVRKLYLTQNNIGPNGATELARAVCAVPSAAHALCRDAPNAAAPIRPQLAHNETIQTITLRRNPIGDRGATAVAIALSHNSTMLSVSIYTNSVGDTGAASFATMLSKNSVLQKLSIYSNGISDESALRFAEVVPQNKSLRKLSPFHRQQPARNI